LLAVRERYQLYAARQLAIPDVQSPGLLVMVHELPETLMIQVTLLNFAPDPTDEIVSLGNVGAGFIVDMLEDKVIDNLNATGDIPAQLAGYEGKSFLLQPA
jgi:hypothetical protein